MRRTLGANLTMIVLFTVVFIGMASFAHAGTTTVGIPSLGTDQAGGPTWLDSGNNYVVWGFDLDCPGALYNYESFIQQQIDAAVYCNSNFVAVPIPWAIVEPTQGAYSYTLADKYIKMATSQGLKVSIQWLGIDYASGTTWFVPAYILNDTTTYVRITGLDNNGDLCPSCQATLNREKTAYYNLLHHLKSNNPGNGILFMETTAETDYLASIAGSNQLAFLPPSRGGLPIQDVRCNCTTCNSLYAGEDNIAFMKTRFAKYVAELVNYGATAYDIPTFNAVCPQSWWPGWRYAEDPYVLYPAINRSNTIVGPSIADVSSASAFITDMNDYTSSKIPGNRIFTDGIDSGAHIDLQVEAAPWYSILYYGGLGAGYWDSGSQWTPASIVNNTTLREKCRKYWGPLKGMEYHLARLKSNALYDHSGNYKFWWASGSPDSSGSLSSIFSCHQTNSGSDYGVAFQLGVNDVCFTGSTYSGPYTMAITCPTGWDGYVFEQGSFDPVTGGWTAQNTVSPTINGNTATLTVSDDSGVWWKSAFRYHSLAQAKGCYRIKNRWTGEYLTARNAVHKVGSITFVAYGNLASQKDARAQWYIEDAGNGYVRFRNRQGRFYMHNSHQLGSVEYGSFLMPSNPATQWKLTNYAGNYEISSRTKPTQYIHNMDLLGYAECGEIVPGWWSAQWSLEQVR